MAIFYDSKITLADNSIKNANDIKIGDVVLGLFGYFNTVTKIYIKHNEITDRNARKIFNINDNLKITGSHLIWSKVGWACIQRDLYFYQPEEGWKNDYGDTFLNVNKLSQEQVVPFGPALPIELFYYDSFVISNCVDITNKIIDGTELLGFETDGSHSCIANGFIISAMARNDNFDYKKGIKI